MIVGDVGELRTAGDVADGVDAPVGRAQRAGRPRCPCGACVMPAASRSRPSTFGLPPGGHQQMACRRSSPRRRTRRARPEPWRRPRLDRARPTPGADRDALARELIEHDRRAFGIVPARAARRLPARSRAAPSRRNACASSRPIGPAPMTTRCCGHSVKVEHRLVGEIRRVREAGNRRQRRRRAGRDDKAPRLDLDVVADRDRVGVAEARRALDHAHAERR